MKTNVDDPRLQNVRAANEAASTARDIGVGVLGCSSPILAGAGLIIEAGAGGVYVAAGLQYYALVGNRQPWDFKHRILEELGRGITLCSTVGCEFDIEYSVPGNIHYGFVSIEAGYGRVLTHAGAAGAEMYDAFRDPERDYKLLDNLGVYPDVGGLGFSLNVGDDPDDHPAVQFGIYLYNKYDHSLTIGQFRRELGLFMNRFDRDVPTDRPVESSVAAQWPYPVGYFAPTR